MFPMVFFAFICIPIIEIWVLIEVGSSIGVLQTIALVVLTAIAGTTLLRAQGLSTWAKLQGKLAHGELPATEMLEAAALLLGGALLLTPGFVTDAIGLLCLLPMTRMALVRWMLARAEIRVAASQQRYTSQQAPGQEGNTAHGQSPGRRDAIEGEYHRDD